MVPATHVALHNIASPSSEYTVLSSELVGVLAFIVFLYFIAAFLIFFFSRVELVLLLVFFITRIVCVLSSSLPWLLRVLALTTFLVPCSSLQVVTR